nr:putative Gag-polypeptide of LTR copia-type [Tanacetum cinerariifolium]
MVSGESSSSTVLVNNLDVNNSLHIQTNDNSSITLNPFKLQGTENYRIWASAMKLSLHARNKFCFVDDTCLKTAYSTSDILSAQWDRCRDIVLTWIMNSFPKMFIWVWSILIMLLLCGKSLKVLLISYQPIRSALLTKDPLLEVKYAILERIPTGDLKMKTVLGTGSESEELYLFDMNKDNAIGEDTSQPPPPPIASPEASPDGVIFHITKDEAGNEIQVPPITAQQILARKRERKAKSTLLMAILDEHLTRFHRIKDAKTLWAAIQTRFG